LNTDSDEADVTSLGRPFHTFAPATGKARPACRIKHIILKLKCTKFDFGSAPDLARRAYPALPHTPWMDLRGATSKGKERKGRRKGEEGKEGREVGGGRHSMARPLAYS